jgi:Glycosyltransferase family 10 (fucosyltransferase) C-term
MTNNRQSSISIYVDPRAGSCPFMVPAVSEYLERNGLSLSPTAFGAGTIVSDSFQRLKWFALRYPRKCFVLWTQEPRYDLHCENEAKAWLGWPRIAIMNVYTKSVFIDNVALWGHVCEKPLDVVADPTGLKSRKLIAVMRYYPPPTALTYKGRDIDLIQLRQTIALYGHERGLCDIVGSNWPNGIALEDSRYSGSWKARKDQWLSQYCFNLCMENTLYPFYCTEKIWDSIRNGCLPIYFGEGSAIYDNFPRRSFIDYGEIADVEKLFKFINELSAEEWAARLNLCIAAFNQAYTERHCVSPSPYERMLDCFIKRVRDCAGTRGKWFKSITH